MIVVSLLFLFLFAEKLRQFEGKFSFQYMELQPTNRHVVPSRIASVGRQTDVQLLAALLEAMVDDPAPLSPFLKVSLATFFRSDISRSQVLTDIETVR